MTVEFRIGQGIDIHRYAAGRPMILGGVEIPCDVGLDGHSDADVVLHALMDALLGAAGLSDIGALFPDTDQKWKGASSLLLLELAWAKISENGWTLVNADLTLLAEKPRVAKFVPLMRERIAERLGVTSDRITVKATTAERLGFIGREEGAVAQAVAMLTRENG